MFEIAEMLGIQDPLNMDMSHRVFLYWKAYREIKLTTIHEKWEFYFAKLIHVVSEGKISMKDALIKFDDEDENSQDYEDELREERFLKLADKVNKG